MKSALLVVVCCFPLLAQPQLPVRPGWVIVDPGRELARNTGWEIPFLFTDQPAGRSVNLAQGVRITSDASYFGILNFAAPRFRVQGSFGMSLVVNAVANTGGKVDFLGRLNANPNSSIGLKMVELGLDNGNVHLGLWDGTRNDPSSYFTFGSGFNGTVTLEAVKSGNQFIVYANGGEVGRAEDPGVFSDGNLIVGLVAHPNKELDVRAMGIEAPADQPSNVIAVDPLGPYPRPNEVSSLRPLTERHGLVSGTVLSLDKLTGQASSYPSGFPAASYPENAVRYFAGIAEAGLIFSWVHPDRKTYKFAMADAFTTFARNNGLKIHHHVLLSSDSHVPEWTKAQSLTRADMEQIVSEHIQTIVDRYKGTGQGWDVVNEAIGPNGEFRTDTPWGRLIGMDFIDAAFRQVHAIDPAAKLCYNDYNWENAGAKANAIVELVRGLVQRGVPIHCVGMQAHFVTGAGSYLPRYDEVVANMKRIADLGLEIRVSELDARVPLPAQAADLAQQTEAYRTIMRACLASPNCIDFYQWGTSDADSWIDGFFQGYGAATMFDRDNQPKAAYQAVIEQLNTPQRPGVNAVNFAQVVAPGTWMSLFGNFPVAGAATASSVPFPKTLGGATVTYNGGSLPLWFVRGDQINVQLPYGAAAGDGQVVVQAGGQAIPVAIRVRAAAPGILVYGANRANAYNFDNSLNTPENGAAVGSVLTFYFTGQGALDNPLPDGDVAKSAPLSRPVQPVIITIGGLPAELIFAGMTPDSVGLAQASIYVPKLRPGSYPVVIRVGAAFSNSAWITVK